MKAGTKIRFKHNIESPANDYSPLMIIARKGEEGVIVRKGQYWDYFVDGTVNKDIGVKKEEIEVI
jgi:hypothetical protein